MCLFLCFTKRERERERGVDKAQKLVPMTTPSLTFASSFTSPTCEIPQFVHLDCSSSVSCANVTFPGLWNWYVSCILAGSFDDDAWILKFVFLVRLSDDTCCCCWCCCCCCCSCRRRRRKHAEYVVLNDVEAAANISSSSSSFVFRGGAAELFFNEWPLFEWLILVRRLFFIYVKN